MGSRTPDIEGRRINFVTSMINFSDNNDQDQDQDQGQDQVSLPDEEGLGQGSSLMRRDIF
jgi:hypothetical protein